MNQVSIDPGMTLDEITNAHPETIAVFNRFGMDICCGGDATLTEASARDGVELLALIEALGQVVAQTGQVA